MKKLSLLLFFLILTSIVYAKDLVYIPTAVSTDGVSASFDYDCKDKNHIFNLVGGYNGFEVSFTNYNNEFDADKFMPQSKSLVSGQWQIIPELGPVPAVAVGVKDLCSKLNKTPAFYAVATKDISDYITWDLLEKLSLTAGVSHQSLGIFGGVDAQVGIFYGTFEAYKKDCNVSCGVTFLDDMIRVGYKRFNKNNYIGAKVSVTF